MYIRYVYVYNVLCRFDNTIYIRIYIYICIYIYIYMNVYMNVYIMYLTRVDQNPLSLFFSLYRPIIINVRIVNKYYF